MSDEQKIDEDAIRAQMDAALSRMDQQQAGSPPPEAGEPLDARAAGKAGRGRKRDGGPDPHLHVGTITAIDGAEVFVELGPRSQGVIALEEFDEPPAVGESFEFSLVSIQDSLWTLSRKEARTLATWKELERGRTVKAKVIGENSGGLELKIGPVTAFMPASEIGIGRVDDFQPLMGQMLVCEVMEASARRKRVVLSRKTVLMRERREQRDRTLESLAVGQVARGTIEKLEKFGAFVDLGGGVSGLLHVSNISHKRIEDPAEVLKPGQAVEVQVLEIKEGGKRIGLGMKQLVKDPWEDAAERLKVGQILKGKVVRTAEFGAFVEIGEGVEGLLHKSQLAPERVNRVADAVAVGQEVTVRVQAVETERRRISLSRLTERGHLIGSEEDVGGEEIGRYLEQSSGGSLGTNLGAVLREALDKKQRSGREPAS